MTPLVRSFLQLYRWLSVPCLPYNYFIIFVRFIENVLHFHFRLKIQTQHFIVPQACTCFVKVCQTCISLVSIHIKTASKMKQNRKYTEKMYGWLASAEKVECGWTLSFCRHKPILFTPIDVRKITQQWKSTFNFPWFLLVLLWSKNTVISVRFCYRSQSIS